MNPIFHDIVGADLRATGRLDEDEIATIVSDATAFLEIIDEVVIAACTPIGQAHRFWVDLARNEACYPPVCGPALRGVKLRAKPFDSQDADSTGYVSDLTPEWLGDSDLVVQLVMKSGDTRTKVFPALLAGFP